MISIWTALIPIAAFLAVIATAWVVKIDKDRKQVRDAEERKKAEEAEEKKAKTVDLYVPEDKVKEFLRLYHNAFIAGESNIVKQHEFWKYAKEVLKDEVKEKCKGAGQFSISIDPITNPKLIFIPKELYET